MFCALVAGAVAIDVAEVEGLAGFDRLPAARAEDAATCDLPRDDRPELLVPPAVALRGRATYSQTSAQPDPFGIVHVFEESCRSRTTLADEARSGGVFLDGEGVKRVSGS